MIIDFIFLRIKFVNYNPTISGHMRKVINLLIIHVGTIIKIQR
jgi:hypothetical protein